jgi:RimJ/RimL family protein N-acetyltransferase
MRHTRATSKQSDCCSVQFRDSDFDAYLQLMTTPELLQSLGGGEQRTREELWRNMAFHAGTWCIRGYGLWALELKATNELIGRAGMWYPEGWPEPEAAWAIDPHHWGLGYATEVLWLYRASSLTR